jgi:hypothetical protein
MGSLCCFVRQAKEGLGVCFINKTQHTKGEDADVLGRASIITNEISSLVSCVEIGMIVSRWGSY